MIKPEQFSAPPEMTEELARSIKNGKKNKSPAVDVVHAENRTRANGLANIRAVEDDRKVHSLSNRIATRATHSNLQKLV